MLTLAFSPCPNDTFIFEGIVNHHIQHNGLQFRYTLHDVENLNRMALSGETDVIKVSFFTYLHVRRNYILLDSGSAMGYGSGPLLIAREPLTPEELKEKVVALPGQYTTAHMLFSIAVPRASRKEFMLFSDIEDAVVSGRADAGVIIHENRFTYEKKGLTKILDLGNYWEQLTGAPVPLGGILARRSLGYGTIDKLNQVMYHSVARAMKYPEAALPFVKAHAREMEEEVIRKHIALYVNETTLSMGPAGRVAIARLEEVARERGLITA